MAGNRPALGPGLRGLDVDGLASGAFPVRSAFHNGFLRARGCGSLEFPEQKRWKSGITASFVMRGSQVRVL